MKKSTNTFLLLALIILSLTPVFWFWGRGDILINGVDTNFPLDPEIWFKRRFFVWNNTTNAGLDFSSSAAGLFFHFIQLVPYIFGLSLKNVQIISLVFWFALIIFSAFFFAREIFKKSSFTQLLFVCLYSLNVYLFNSWENVKVANLSLVAGVPLALLLLIKRKEKKISLTTFLFLSSLVGIVISGTGINPAYIISLFLLLSIFVIGEILADLSIPSIKSIITTFLLFGITIAVTNAYWILPTLYHLAQNISPQDSLLQLGFTSWVDSLSENTSLVNTIRMQGAWDWYAFDQTTGLPLYIPYALNYFHRLPFIVFSFMLPLLAVASYLIPKKRQSSLYISFGLMFIVGVFLGSGTHSPTGVLFRWLTEHVPFFSLFRSPWYIFTPLVALSTAGLVSLFFYKLINYKTAFLKITAHLGIATIIIGNLFYSYPLLTGKIYRPGRHDSFFVSFPDYVFESAKWLSQSNKGRIIGYPDDEIERFNWGYTGVESILGLLTNREVFFSPLNATHSPTAKLTKEFYRNLKRNETSSANKIAGKLGINTIFEKKDQNSITYSLSKNFSPLQKTSFGKWNFYTLPFNSSSKFSIATSITQGFPYEKGQKILSLVDDNSILVNPTDSVVNEINPINFKTGKIILAENSQEEEYLTFTGSPSKLSNRLTGFYPETSQVSSILLKYPKTENISRSWKLTNLKILGSTAICLFWLTSTKKRKYGKYNTKTIPTLPSNQSFSKKAHTK